MRSRKDNDQGKQSFCFVYFNMEDNLMLMDWEETTWKSG